MQLETERLRILPLPQLKLRLEGMPRFEHEAMASPAELAEKIPSSCPWAANWQIIWKERNCSVGSAGFMNVPDETGEVEIRCGITPAFQRRGFMTEALRAIAAWALEQPGVTGVIAETEPENTASRRVLARCGFKPVSATRWRRLGPAEITYRELPAGEIETGLFASFNRYQEVKRCRRRENGRNVLKEIAFTEQWSAEDYRLLAEALRGAVAAGGAVFGAFDGKNLIGFASLENRPRGSRNQYLQLSNLHVSAEYRGRGIGRLLFRAACRRAAELRAERLYISAHSAEETQAFYRALNCTEAEELMPDLFELEPCDCHLEFRLSPGRA